MLPSARLLILFIVITSSLLAGSLLLWYLSYGLEEDPPKAVALNVVEDSVHIGWHKEGLVSIHAEHPTDGLAALGYVHGYRRAWSVVLWRQAALGRLSEWFGTHALPLDQLTRRLDLGGQAQKSYAMLSEEERQELVTYTAGLNAALSSTAVQLQQEFILLGHTPSLWQPWHTLALERLFAWLATPPPPLDSLADADTTILGFFAADRMLREWLRLHGFENSVAWISNDASGPHLFQRHVYGDTALPFFQEVTLMISGRLAVQGASLPGTPFFPAGQSENASWALMLTSSAALEQMAWHPDSVHVEYQRIKTKDSAEHLASFWRHRDGLPLRSFTDSDSPDTTAWSLRWTGLSASSDYAAWRALQAGVPQPFRVFDGNGLLIHADTTWHVLGTPAVSVSLPSGVFVGASPWATYTAEFLLTQDASAVQLESWINDAFSIWAAQIAPPLVNTLGDLPRTVPPLRDALTYLRNWDYTYDRASIGASIFDRWMMHYSNTTGRLPGMVALDSVILSDPRLQSTLVEAIDALIETHGEDQSQWRWERLHPDRRYFPIWSAEALKDAAERPVATARFAAVDWPGHGHPSALAWSPSPTQQMLAAPAAWETWYRPEERMTLSVRRRYFNPHAPLGRYLISDRAPTPVRLPAPAPASSQTLLTPRSP